MTEIRDPVHGPIALDAGETAIVDSLPYQRLRNIKQLGFAEMTFPGSTHTRYLHSLGTLHLAGRVFDQVFPEGGWLVGAERARFRQAVRLAALLHDVGHPPLSHTVERLLPPLAELGLPEPFASEDRRAGHEDMSLAVITRTEVGDRIDERFGGLGVTRDLVAGLVEPALPVREGAYVASGRDLRPVLCQIVSSELDVDRMDYLLRDSYFTGASYGRFDHDWLIRGLTHHESDGVVNLALHGRAVLAFEDFLLSRYHMFVMVYFHQRTNAYDRMLLRFFESLERPFTFPSDLSVYCEYDDAHVYAILREHRKNPWSRSILERKPLPLVAALEGERARRLEPVLDAAVRAAGCHPEWIASTGILSKYHGKTDDAFRRIYVVEERARAIPLEKATDLFARYQEKKHLLRLHVPVAEKERARKVADEVLAEA